MKLLVIQFSSSSHHLLLLRLKNSSLHLFFLVIFMYDLPLGCNILKIFFLYILAQVLRSISSELPLIFYYSLTITKISKSKCLKTCGPFALREYTLFVQFCVILQSEWRLLLNSALRLLVTYCYSLWTNVVCTHVYIRQYAYKHRRFVVSSGQLLFRVQVRTEFAFITLAESARRRDFNYECTFFTLK